MVSQIPGRRISSLGTCDRQILCLGYSSFYSQLPRRHVLTTTNSFSFLQLCLNLMHATVVRNTHSQYWNSVKTYSCWPSFCVQKLTDLMVATTTTMHSVTGTKSIMTCLAPYFRVSSSSSSSSVSVTTCGARVEGGWPLSSTPLRGRAVDLPVSVCWLASAPSRDCTQKGNDQNGVMHCASLYGKSDGLVACRMIISTVVIC